MEGTLAARWGATSEHRFYGALSVAMLLTVVVGFSRSFFLRPLFPAWPSPPEPIFYVHGVLFAAWPALLVVQSYLVSSKRVSLHRRLGVAGAVLAAAMVVVGFYAALVAARRPSGFVGIPVPPLQFLVMPMFDLLLFSVFVALAVAKRRNLQAHKRWTLLATMNLVTAAIARWPGVISVGSPVLFFALADLFLVALVLWDLRSRGRIHPVTAWGGAAWLVSQPFRLAFSGTAAWAAIATWLTGLLG